MLSAAASWLRNSRKLRSLPDVVDYENCSLIRFFSNDVGKETGGILFSKHNPSPKQVHSLSLGINKTYSWKREYNSRITNDVFSCGLMASSRPYSSTPENVAEDNLTKIINGDGCKEINVHQMTTATVVEEEQIERSKAYKLPPSTKPVAPVALKAQPEPSQPKVEDKVPCFFPLCSSRGPVQRSVSGLAGSCWVAGLGGSQVPGSTCQPPLPSQRWLNASKPNTSRLFSTNTGPDGATHDIKPWDNDFYFDYEERDGVRGPIGDDGLPTYVNWTKAGAVTPVQDQGICSCWAMAAVSPIESLHFIATGKLVKLSEQQLLDCNDVSNDGCRIGSVEAAFDHIIHTGGVVEAKYYHYTGQQGACRRMTAPGVTIDHYEVITLGSEWDLKWAVARQPVAVYMKADKAFYDYTGGIVEGDIYACGDHYLTMVAYDSANGRPYWLAKNSWGTTWGEDGYIRILRGVNRACGPFGITQRIVYPVKWTRNVLCSVKSDEDMAMRRRRPFRRSKSRAW